MSNLAAWFQDRSVVLKARSGALPAQVYIISHLHTMFSFDMLHHFKLSYNVSSIICL